MKDRRPPKKLVVNFDVRLTTVSYEAWPSKKAAKPYAGKGVQVLVYKLADGERYSVGEWGIWCARHGFVSSWYSDVHNGKNHGLMHAQTESAAEEICVRARETNPEWTFTPQPFLTKMPSATRSKTKKKGRRR